MTITGSENLTMTLPELPKQPERVPWPTTQWPRREAGLDKEVITLCAEIMGVEGDRGVSYALLLVQGGEIIYESYAHGANAFYLQYSWSMAKSITHALIGVLVRQGRLDIHARAPIAEWEGDARSEITIDHLLRMSSGLKFNEDYVNSEVSDVIQMLQFEGRHDTGAFASSKPLLHVPGEHWSYSSGTTNILCRILRDTIEGGASGMLRFMSDELFDPLGIRSATPKFDRSGTFIGSSYLLATPQDFARFGLLYLRGGTWDGREIVSRDWVDYARTPTHLDDESGYGAHWWLHPEKPDWFYCSGYDGQRILVVPKKDVVAVRLGRTGSDHADYVWQRLSKVVDGIDA